MARLKLRCRECRSAMQECECPQVCYRLICVNPACRSVFDYKLRAWSPQGRRDDAMPPEPEKLKGGRA